MRGSSFAGAKGDEVAMVCDILIRSYYKDLDWLDYCVRSIRRFARGFRDVVVVVPERSRARLERVRIRCDRVVLCPDYRDDYLGQQVTKLHADAYSDAPFVCHVDSDCIFDRPLAPSDLLANGKPEIAMAPYRALVRSRPWQTVTEAFVGERVENEYMRRQPVLYPAWVYPALRRFCLDRHRTNLTSYVLDRPPRGFSEYNAMGAFLHRHHADRFTWTDVADDGASAASLCRWYWSWGRISEELRAELETLLQ